MQILKKPTNGMKKGTAENPVVTSHPIINKIIHFFMVFGPGLIVMLADNDAGAVSTYTQAGAQYGTNLFWLLLLLLPVTYFSQEMVVRLGIVTGKGYASVIFNRFGKWWGNFTLINLQLVNFLTIITEFAAIALASSMLGISPLVTVPISAISLITMVVTGSYLSWERVSIFLCALDLFWIALLFITNQYFSVSSFIPTVPQGGISYSFMFIVIAIVGTTIAPWQLFFQQSVIAEKKLRFKDLFASRLDTFVGACLTILVAGCMMLMGNILYTNNIPYTDPAQMANSLGTFFGPVVKYGILLLMINASILGSTAISLSSAFAYSEVKGWKHSLEMKFKDAPGFYSFYSLAVLLAAGITLIPNVPLQTIIIAVQVLAGLLLPPSMIFLQLLLNDKKLLGEEYCNKKWNNIINWIIITILFVLSGILTIQIFL